MDEVNKAESHMTSAAAFIEGGIQDACDDSCSICLESFCESNPYSVTTCKHEFHLQCILEWCQRSLNCPMCWQPISLKDPSSQELLEAVERERRLRFNPARNATIFHHPALGDFEMQHLPAGVNDAELEDRIFQHLAAAAAMGRARHIARREGSRSRSSAHGRPHFVVFSTHTNAPAAGPASASMAPVIAEHEPAVIVPANLSLPQRAIDSESPEHTPHFSSIPGDHLAGSSSGSIIISTNSHEVSFENRSSARHSSMSQDRAGPSDFQTISESWKSRLHIVTLCYILFLLGFPLIYHYRLLTRKTYNYCLLFLRYKETISKSTRGWKEKLFSRSTSMAEIGSEVRREVNAGNASVSRMMERLETGENGRAGPFSASNDPIESSVTEQSNHDNMITRHATPQNDTPALAATSVSR